ncbi:MAG: FkbM family methyltransferase [bacterium]
MISYAQNFEDVYLARAFRDRRSGFYVDVGAWDPVRDSVTKHFYDLGWCGINIEPLPHLIRAFTAQRPRDRNLQGALSNQAGRATFYSVANGSGFSTLSAEIATSWARRGLAAETIDIPVWTLADVYRMCRVRVVDFLKIDVEGAEDAVIAGADWTAVRPRIVLVEATRPGSPEPAWEAWEPALLAHDYAFALFDGLNRYYVRGEDRGLLEAFRIPPNVFDGFTPYALVAAHAAAKAWAERAKAAEQQLASRGPAIVASPAAGGRAQPG